MEGEPVIQFVAKVCCLIYFLACLCLSCLLMLFVLFLLCLV